MSSGSARTRTKRTWKTRKRPELRHSQVKEPYRLVARAYDGPIHLHEVAVHLHDVVVHAHARPAALIQRRRSPHEYTRSDPTVGAHNPLL